MRGIIWLAHCSSIDRAIPQEIVDCVIRPATSAPPFNAFEYFGTPLKETEGWAGRARWN